MNLWDSIKCLEILGRQRFSRRSVALFVTARWNAHILCGSPVGASEETFASAALQPDVY
jgi:hypothetical protein